MRLLLILPLVFVYGLVQAQEKEDNCKVLTKMKSLTYSFENGKSRSHLVNFPSYVGIHGNGVIRITPLPPFPTNYFNPILRGVSSQFANKLIK